MYKFVHQWQSVNCIYVFLVQAILVKRSLISNVTFQICKKNVMNLNVHMKRAHNRNKKESNECPTCLAKFKERTGLQRHILSVHDPTKRKCQICSKELSSQRALIEHIQRIHDENYKRSNKRKACQMCPEIFMEGSELNDHVEQVHGKVPDKIVCKTCHICQKTIVRGNGFKTHMRSHLNVRPFQCQSCDKTFLEKAKLQRHVVIVHEKLKLFPCDKCGKAFQGPILSSFLVFYDPVRAHWQGHRMK